MIVVDSGEKEYVFNILDKFNITYKIEEVRFWICGVCDRVYNEEIEKCKCGSSDISYERAGDITNDRRSFIMERKKDSDLYSSIRNNRLYEQLERIGSLFNGNAMLLFEGNIEKLAEENPDRKYQILSIPATCMQYGVQFMNLPSLKTLALMLKYFDAKSGRKPKTRFKKQAIHEKFPEAVNIYMRIKGIGKKTAINLYKEYPSVCLLAKSLEAKKMKKIKGIGPKTIGILYKWLVAR